MNELDGFRKVVTRKAVREFPSRAAEKGSGNEDQARVED